METMKKIWKLYILRCGDGTLYTGITDNISARLEAHRTGRGAKYTRGRGPLELVYQEECGLRSQALKREIQVKRLRREEKLALCRKKENRQMTFEEVRKNAGARMENCRACPVCNGRGCGSAIPGPGAKGSGKVFARNYDAWQEIYLNMDTIAPGGTVDTQFDFFGQSIAYPIFAAPIGAVGNHYGKALTETDYDRMLVQGCREAGIAAFTGDGLNDLFFTAGCEAMAAEGFAVPTVKPWNRELVLKKIDFAKAHGAKVLCMDVDAAGLPFLKNTNPPSGSKTVEELKEIMEYAGVPFLLKGIMTPRGAEKAMEAGAAGIIVSNHGGRVLDGTPATAWVLPQIADTVAGKMKIWVDGGIRTGQDIFKALALGADGVLIGRPFVTAVYGGGPEGIGVLTQQLGRELRDAMEMCGARRLQDISRDMLWQKTK